MLQAALSQVFLILTLNMLEDQIAHFSPLSSNQGKYEQEPVILLCCLDY